MSETTTMPKPKGYPYALAENDRNYMVWSLGHVTGLRAAAERIAVLETQLAEARNVLAKYLGNESNDSLAEMVEDAIAVIQSLRESRSELQAAADYNDDQWSAVDRKWGQSEAKRAVLQGRLEKAETVIETVRSRGEFLVTKSSDPSKYPPASVARTLAVDGRRFGQEMVDMTAAYRLGSEVETEKRP